MLCWSFGGVSTLKATSVVITNPSFEAPYQPVTGNSSITGVIANGWADNSSWADVQVRYAKETKNTHSGAACQKIVVTAVNSGEVQMIQNFNLQGASVYTASVWLRGVSGTRAIVRIQQGVPPYTSLADAYTVPLTTGWQQVTVRGYVTDAQPASLMIAANAPGTIWVDDATMSFSPGSYGPTPNLGVIPGNFFGMHVANYLQSTLRNPGLEPPYVSAGAGGPINGLVALNWQDNSSWADVNVTYSEDTANPHSGVAAQEVDVLAVTTGAVQFVEPVTVTPGQNYTMTAFVHGTTGASLDVLFQNQNEPYNQYALTTVALQSTWQRVTVSGTIGDTGAVLLMFRATAPETFYVDDVRFVGANGKPVSGGVPWPSETFGTLRLWDSGTAWTNLQPTQDSWNFVPLDTWVAAAQAHGVQDIILTLGQSPAWASSDPSIVNYYGAGAPAPPKNISDWTNYVTTVAQRYKNSIRYYEIWNEPNDATYFTGTVAQLAQLTQAASAALKAVDPGITVISAPAYSAGYLDLLLGTGIGSSVDVIGYHVYDTPPEDTGRQLANVRLVTAARGVSDKPLWDTEGASGDTTTAETLAPAYLTRKFLTDLAFGSGRYDWYTWGPATNFCVGTELNDRSTSTAGQAYGYLNGWLAGATLTSASIDPVQDWQIYLALTNGDQGIIVWNPVATTQFTVPVGFNLYEEDDIYGNVTPVSGSTVSVGEDPVLLRGH